MVFWCFSFLSFHLSILYVQLVTCEIYFLNQTFKHCLPLRSCQNKRNPCSELSGAEKKPQVEWRSAIIISEPSGSNLLDVVPGRLIAVTAGEGKWERRRVVTSVWGQFRLVWVGAPSFSTLAKLVPQKYMRSVSWRSVSNSEPKSAAEREQLWFFDFLADSPPPLRWRWPWKKKIKVIIKVADYFRALYKRIQTLEFSEERRRKGKKKSLKNK